MQYFCKKSQFKLESALHSYLENSVLQCTEERSQKQSLSKSLQTWFSSCNTNDNLMVTPEEKSSVNQSHSNPPSLTVDTHPKFNGSLSKQGKSVNQPREESSFFFIKSYRMNLKKGFNYIIESLSDIIGCYKLTELILSKTKRRNGSIYYF